MVMPALKCFTPEQLREEYEVAGMSQVAISKKYGVSSKSVANYLVKFGITLRPKGATRNQYGSNNHMWKASDVGYGAAHRRVGDIRGKPKLCEVCRTADPNAIYDWANLTGRFADPYDYKRMCRSCHWRHDNKHYNLGKYARKGYRWKHKSSTN